MSEKKSIAEIVIEASKHLDEDDAIRLLVAFMGRFQAIEANDRDGVPNARVRKLTAEAYRTGLASLFPLFERRFGRKLDHPREVVDWLCSQGTPKHKAETMSFEKMADALRPKPAELAEIDQLILEVMTSDSAMSGMDIWTAVSNDDEEPTYDYVRRRLGPSAPLCKLGFILRPDGQQGYIRQH